MLYLIKEKPYVKVSNYYKEVTVDKKGKEYIVKPTGGKETRIEKTDMKEISQISVEDFYKKNSGKISNDSASKIL